MASWVELKSDALKYHGSVIVPEVHQDHLDMSEMVNLFSLSDLKTMLFLCFTDLSNKTSLDSYLKLVVADDVDYLRFQFSKKWHDSQLRRSDLIELLGIMKKFKPLKRLGLCKHIFMKQQNIYNTIPKMCKLFFSICEELDDREVKVLRCDLFPETSKDVCGEELICLMLQHEKITSSDFGLLKRSLTTLGRDDLISVIETYENQERCMCPSDFYPIRQPTISNPSGLALVINQIKFTGCELDIPLEERKGSEVDCRELEKLWHCFGCKVEVRRNLTEGQFHMLLEDLMKRDLSHYDVFVLCIMSHGKKGCFYSSDSKAIHVDSFITDVADRIMIGKPKLFFIQACQGEQHNEGVPVYPQPLIRRNLSTDSRPEIERLPRHADVLKAVATVDNYVSYRDEDEGTYFISHLVKNMSKYGDKEDIQLVLTKVIDDISEKNAQFDNHLYKQVPVQTSTLRRRLILKRVLMEAV